MAAGPSSSDPSVGERVEDAETPPVDGDLPLHSVVSVKVFAVHAADGDIGHVENLLADDSNWEIRYLVVATWNWWPGKVGQLAPYAVKDIEWFDRHINVNVTRAGEVGPGMGPAGDEGQGEGG